MSRLVTCGWESGDPNENQSVVDANWICANTAPVPKAPSTYYVKSSAGNNGKAWIFGAAKTDAYARVRVYLTAGAFSTISGLMEWQDSAYTTQVHLDWSNTDHLLRVYRAIGTGTLLGTSSLPLDFNVWHVLESRWQASSATVGIVQVWLDGTLVINLSGVDTTATANVSVQRFNLNSTNANTALFDDLAINDTNGTLNNGQIGDGAVVLLKPSGAGSNTGQTRGGTDTGANWSQVSEVPSSMAQYVQSAVVGDRDTYALEDIPAGSWTVNCVEVVALGQNSDAGAGSLGLTVKSGATTNEGTAQSLGITAAYLRQLYETDPATSAAWTNANVNALEAGTTVR